MTEAKVGLMIFGDGGNTYEPRNSGGPKKVGKGKELDCFIAPLEMPRQRLEFISLSLILDFWPPELQDNKFVLF